MIKDFNLVQINRFTSLLLTLQKKDNLIGFIIGLVPILVTGFSIELFIGKVIGGEIHTDGIKGVCALFFIFFSNSISQSTISIKNYSSIIKNSYLQPMTVMLSEILLQYLTFIIAFLIFILVFNISFIKCILLIILSFLLFIYTLALTNSLLVLTSILEDFGRILSIIFQMLFWVSPILYSIRSIKTELVYMFMTNPFYIFFELIYLINSPESFDHNFFWWGFSSSLIFLITIYLLLREYLKKNNCIFIKYSNN